MPDDITPPPPTTHLPQGPPAAPNTRPPARHPTGSLVMPSSASPAPAPLPTPAPPSVAAKNIQPVGIAPAPATPPPLAEPPAPTPIPAPPAPEPETSSLNTNEAPPDEAQLQTMRKTYRVPVEKLARKYEGSGHIFLIVFLLLLVIGVGVAALLITGTLSV